MANCFDVDPVVENTLKLLRNHVSSGLNERDRRLLFSSFSLSLGYGGVSYVSSVTGLSRNTLSKGEKELQRLSQACDQTEPIPDANDQVSDTESNVTAEPHVDKETVDEPSAMVDPLPSEDPEIEIVTEKVKHPILSPSELIDRILSRSSKRIPDSKRQRKKGGGRKSAVESDPELMDAVLAIVSENTYGNPESILVHTNLSLRKIVDEIQKRYGKKTNPNVVSYCLRAQGYSLQQNAKLEQVGNQHIDKEAQFNHINETADKFIKEGNPVISIDCKKKENVGNFKNAGKEYQKSKSPRKVNDHDFYVPELGKVAPYGVYTLNDNTGFINLGTSHDTAEFSVESIRAWWYTVGVNTFSDASMLYITCDGGGSNASNSRLFKMEIASLATEIGLPIQVSHFPPGTSKWNKIEHRLFAMISKNWAGKPLVSVETIVSLIGSTTTKTGLKVICKVDKNHYETGLKVSDADFDSIDIEYINIGTSNKWNYIIRGFKLLN